MLGFGRGHMGKWFEGAGRKGLSHIIRWKVGFGTLSNEILSQKGITIEGKRGYLAKQRISVRLRRDLG